MAIRWRLRAAATSAAIALAGAGLIGLAPMATAAATPAKPYDFNGDGYTDIALGSPYGRVGTVKHAGFITVVYGSTTGLNTTHKKVISQNSTGIPGAAEPEDHFGYALTSADWNADGFADLAVGIPGEDTGKGVDTGYATIIWGTRTGLTTLARGVTNPNTGPGYRYGEVLTTGDLWADGVPDLYVGYPGGPGYGSLDFPEPGTPAGRTRVTAHTTDHPLLPTARAGAFSRGVDAEYMAMGDVNGDGADDLALGWRDSDAMTSLAQSGFTLYSTSGETGIAGEGLYVDGLMSSIALGDFNGDSFADVAVGNKLDTLDFGGEVFIYWGSAHGINYRDYTGLGQYYGNIPSVVSNDEFGWSLAVGDANGDHRADLAVGAPSHDVGAAKDAGMAAIFYGTPTGVTNAQVFTQNTAGIPGGSETGDHLGWAVSLLDHNRDGKAELSIGVPNENGTEGYLEILGGAAPKITTTGAVAFGSGTLGVYGRTALIGLRVGRR